MAKVKPPQFNRLGKLRQWLEEAIKNRHFWSRHRDNSEKRELSYWKNAVRQLELASFGKNSQNQIEVSLESIGKKLLTTSPGSSLERSVLEEAIRSSKDLR
ncbi:MAG: hypothetical protein U1A78_23995 [Polyangia bacterium]